MEGFDSATFVSLDDARHPSELYCLESPLERAEVFHSHEFPDGAWIPKFTRKYKQGSSLSLTCPVTNLQLLTPDIVS